MIVFAHLTPKGFPKIHLKWMKIFKIFFFRTLHILGAKHKQNINKKWLQWPANGPTEIYEPYLLL